MAKEDRQVPPTRPLHFWRGFFIVAHLHLRGKAQAFQLHGIHANMDQKFNAGFAAQADGMPHRNCSRRIPRDHAGRCDQYRRI